MKNEIIKFQNEGLTEIDPSGKIDSAMQFQTEEKRGSNCAPFSCGC